MGLASRPHPQVSSAVQVAPGPGSETDTVHHRLHGRSQCNRTGMKIDRRLAN